MIQTTLPTARCDLVLALGFRHIIDRPGDAFGPVTADYAEAARLAGVSTSDVECFAHDDIPDGPWGRGWSMYVLRKEPDDQVSLFAYLIWRERHERGCTVEEAFEQAKAAYAARDAEVEAFTAALIEECREPDLPLTEGEHAYWDRVMAEAEAAASDQD